MNKNFIFLIAIAFIIPSFLSGCGSSKLNDISELQNKVANLEKVIEDTVNTINQEEFSDSINKDEELNGNYSSILSHYVFQGSQKYFRTNKKFPYSKMISTGEYLQNNGNEKVYKYEAEIIDLDEPPFELWQSDIIITKDEMIETNPLSSIAKNKIQLKLPLEVGNTWEQTIEYEGKSYVMKHEITEMKGEKNKETIFVLSTVDNLAQDGGTYIEIASYTYNRGLTVSDRDEGFGHGYFTFGLSNETDIEKYNE